MNPVVTDAEAEEAVRTLLKYVGDDPSRPGLEDTPRRVRKMYKEIFSGLSESCPKPTVFPNEGDELVAIQDIPFNSMCEHHLVPFMGKVHVGYLPAEKRENGKVLGLSKFARVVHWVAARPQIQETMTSQIADRLMKITHAQGVIVVVKAEHMCMSLRGVKCPNVQTSTAAIRGEIDKFEFFQMLNLRT